MERFNKTLLMILAMFAGENKDDWDDLLPAVMMAYRSSVYESTGFSLYRLMFGEECTLPMDIGLPRQDLEPPDVVTSPFAVWVRDALEVAFDQVRRNSGLAVQRHKDYTINDACLLLVTGLYDITPQGRSANWTRCGWARLWWCPSSAGRWAYRDSRTVPFSSSTVRM